MIVGYEIEAVGLEEQIELLREFPLLSNRELVTAMNKSVSRIENNVLPFVPVDRGRLRGSIGSNVQEISALSIVGRVGSSLSDEVYPQTMEFGREPGKKFPPMEPLEAWVRRVVLRNEEDEGKIRSVTFLIARKIATKGIQAREFLKKGFEKSLDDVKDYFAEALENIANGLSNRQ